MKPRAFISVLTRARYCSGFSYRWRCPTIMAGVPNLRWPLCPLRRWSRSPPMITAIGPGWVRWYFACQVVWIWGAHRWRRRTDLKKPVYLLNSIQAQTVGRATRTGQRQPSLIFHWPCSVVLYSFMAYSALAGGRFPGIVLPVKRICSRHLAVLCDGVAALISTAFAADLPGRRTVNQFRAPSH